MKNSIRNQFLTNTDETGRFIVSSLRTGKQYFVEPIGDSRTDWGSIDPSTGNLTTKKGWKKNKGSIEEKESLITKENGFDKIHTIEKGQSPLDFIYKLDEKYPNLED